MSMHCIELCAGAGGQALGLERAGFAAQALVEIDPFACHTLRLNRPTWNIVQGDVGQFAASAYKSIDLVAGGVPCPPFSVAGKQLGADDERDLFPEALRVVDEARPTAVLFENVRGFLDSTFEPYRTKLQNQLEKMGYQTTMRLLQASDYGVSQLRPRVVIVALQKPLFQYFTWAKPLVRQPQTVGDRLHDLMAENGWRGADSWRLQASGIAPTIVGGSRKHGGPDLGPTRAKRAWANLGVDGHGIADHAPAPDFVGLPRLTNRMVARLQGFPDPWLFAGKKTATYRQIGNAFPPPVAAAVAGQIYTAITSFRSLFFDMKVAV